MKHHAHRGPSAQSEELKQQVLAQLRQGNPSNDYRASFGTPGYNGGPQQLREILDDRQIQLAAKTELGKLGLDINLHADATDRSGLLARRAHLRRTMNAVYETVESGKPETATKAKSDAIDYLASEIALISIVLDLADANANGPGASAGAARSGSTKLRDQDGKLIGVHLTNQTLRSERSIADQLKAHANGDGDVSMTEFFRGIANMRTTESVRNALSVGTDTAGGYTVPTVLMPGILGALVPASAMLNAGASIAVLQDQAKSFNIAGIDSIPTAGWRNEAGAVAESEPAFRSIVITPRSLAFRFKISRELLADSPNLDEALRVAVAGAFAKELDRAGLRGTGTAPEIRGLLNIANINTVASGTNGAAPTNYSKFVNAWKEIVSDNAPEPKAAILHPRDMATFANLVDTTGQPLRRPELLDPMQFFQTSQIPTNLTVGSSTDCSEIYVGDFAQFVFFMREGISIQLVTELYAETGQLGFICHTRVDVAAMYAQAFAVITGIRP